jgi:hypothetical protein
MLDFTPVRNKEITMNQLASGLSQADLKALTNEMVDEMLHAIAGCRDAAVTFVPIDPDAEDRHASNSAETYIAWTLGHVIVHTTASAEESAALACEMARGVAHHGRSRYETSWQTVSTMAQCIQRLEESRRIRLASLDMWPDTPQLDIEYAPWEGADPVNAKARFIMGLRHDATHLGQIREIVRQVQKASL